MKERQKLNPHPVGFHTLIVSQEDKPYIENFFNQNQFNSIDYEESKEVFNARQILGNIDE